MTRTTTHKNTPQGTHLVTGMRYIFSSNFNVSKNIEQLAFWFSTWISKCQVNIELNSRWNCINKLWWPMKKISLMVENISLSPFWQNETNNFEGVVLKISFSHVRLLYSWHTNTYVNIWIGMFLSIRVILN